MEHLGPPVGGLETTVRTKRSQITSRPRPQPQLFSESHGLLPLPSPPLSDDLSKVSGDVHIGDANFRGKMFKLNQFMSRGPSTCEDEEAYSHKKIKEEDGGIGTHQNNGNSGDLTGYGQTIFPRSRIVTVDSLENDMSFAGACQIEFSNGLPQPQSQKLKEQRTEVEQLVKKAEAAQRRRMQNEKAVRETQEEAIRKVLGQDSNWKKREDNLKKCQEELPQEKAANPQLYAPTAISWVTSTTRTWKHKELRWLILKWLLILLYISCVADANLRAQPPDAVPLTPPPIPVMPLQVNLPLFRRSLHKEFSPFVDPKLELEPAQPPHYDPFVTSHHLPSSSTLSKPSMKKGGLVSPSVGHAPPRLADIAPVQSGPSTLPAGLAQPPLSPHTSNCCGPDMVLKRGTQGCHCVFPIKLDLLLLNVSSNPNWNHFLQEFATQLGLQASQIELINFYMLGLSRLNISMDITPYKGLSFTAHEAAQINSSLSLHRVRLDPSLVGEYQILNLTWFKPLAASPAPLSAVPPVEASPKLPSTSASVASSTKGNHSSLILIVGIGAGILIIAIISLLIICKCASSGKKRTSIKEPAKTRAVDAVPSAVSLPHPHPTSTRFLTYEELKEATNNFETASILGEGGFGRVFKGILHDGTAVAIKRLTSGGQQGDKEFLVEVDMLSRLHHRNLVKLIGYYSNRDSSQNLLCYELVPNGSLESWLHGPLGMNCPLDWDTRMKIALDSARGLAYLHEDSQPCVIHRDFKASNILLENNFHAKVADFGLAKQAPEGRANFLSTRVMGTFGYVAPEYAMTGHLLVKSDVYSYGVVLLELLTGRKPVDMSQPSGQENLVTWARPILRDKERLEELADPTLQGKYPLEDFVRVCTIAAACVAPEATQRPTMGEVVQSLKMVQRVAEYQDPALASNGRPNLRQSSTTLESDGTSSIFSSGPYSGLSVYDNDNISRTAVFSEDLHEGR